MPHDTDLLIHRVAGGDRQAQDQLLARHRSRLRQMISLRLDRRVLARLDPSDVVQEVLADAARRLSAYIETRPLPFYPWLRQIAWDHLIELHREHVKAQRRSVQREEHNDPALPDQSAVVLARRLADRGLGPVSRVLRNELVNRVRLALDELPERDRELLILRHVEQLSADEIAAIFGITTGAVYTRHVRALERLRARLGKP